MSVNRWNGCKELYLAFIGRKWVEMAGTAKTWPNIAVSRCKLLYIAKIAVNGCKWLEMAVNDCKRFDMAKN